MKKTLFILLLFSAIGGFISFGLSQKAPLPSNIRIVLPDPTLPDEIKSLSGKWAGQWNSRWHWDCLLIVEKVDKDTAQVVLSWGEYTTSRGSCHCTPNWTRVIEAKIESSKGKVILRYFTPNLQALQSRDLPHRVKGSVGPYSFSFELDKGHPDILKGHFLSGKQSPLDIEMKKIGESKDSGEGSPTGRYR